MGHPLKLPALGALAVAGAAFGLHLGESAVSGINPIHFQGAAVHPRDRGAALPDTPLAPIRSEFALAYGWDQGANARAEDCPSCGPAASSQYYSRSHSGYRSDVDVALEPAPPRPRQPAPVEAEEQPDAFTAQYASVERYARYDIEQRSAEAAPAEAMADEAEYSTYEE